MSGTQLRMFALEAGRQELQQTSQDHSEQHWPCEEAKIELLVNRSVFEKASLEVCPD